MTALLQLEQLLAELLRSEDPVRALEQAKLRTDLAEATRAALGHVEADGLRMAALLVAKLRFERLMNASPRANKWFERDGPGFTKAFRRYHRETAAHSPFPGHEAEHFAAWLKDSGTS